MRKTTAILVILILTSVATAQRHSVTVKMAAPVKITYANSNGKATAYDQKHPPIMTNGTGYGSQPTYNGAEPLSPINPDDYAPFIAKVNGKKIQQFAVFGGGANFRLQNVANETRQTIVVYRGSSLIAVIQPK